jgi:mannitol-1-phosphate/altronate dehydrogenase
MNIDIEKSAGPSTVVLVTLEEEKTEMLKKLVKRDVQVVGTMVTHLGYNCYQKFENRNPYIRLTRYLVTRWRKVER